MASHREFWNPERETMSPAERRDLQNEKLRAQVHHGYANAPIVRELWDDAGVHPDEIETVDDLENAPIFRKDDARKRQIDTGDPYGGRLCQPASTIAEEGGATISSSSGTTGTPTNYIVSEHDRRIAAECMARHLWSMGLRPGETYLNLTIPNHVGFDSYADAAREIGANVTNVNHDPNEVHRLVHCLEYLDPTVLKLVSPPLVTAIEDYFEENGLDPKAVWEPLESLGYAGEPLVPGERARLEEEWGVEIFENAGGLEPHWYPQECSEHGRWLHMNDDHFYPEVVDPDTGERVPEGERGELIITPLSYTAMSHVRWAHDDIVELKRGECACGRTTTRLKFLGRVGDVVEVAGKTLLPWDVWLLVEDVEEMPGNLFQFFADSEEALRLRLGYHPDRTADPDATADRVRDHVERELGVPVEVVDTMPEDELAQLGPPHKIPRITEE